MSEPGMNEPTTETIEAVYTYSRAQAIADGALVDVSAMAREAGFTFPVALTASLHGDIAAIPDDRPWQSYDGRLWDVLNLFRAAVQGFVPSEGDDQRRIFSLYLATSTGIEDFDEKDRYYVKAVCGPGDDAEPVITLMKPEES